MCIVLDTNILPCVLSPRNCHHSEYVPIYKWIISGPGFAVYGGSAYLGELSKAKTYLGIILELKKKGKVKVVNREIVDSEHKAVKKSLPSACDDSHLIAIFRASGCRLLCSNDKRSDLYIKNRIYYPKGQHPPKIYRRKSHAHLLTQRNIVQIRNIK